MKLRYTERAQEDLEIAVSWYEKQQRGLGLAFLESVESSLEPMESSPNMYEIIYASHRRCLIRRFPFSLFYTIEADGLVIHAVFDNRQDPVKRP